MAAFVETLGETLLSKNGEVKTSEALKDKVVLLYFSAHWCPPCRGFTPVLSALYTKLKEAGKAVECVFVSSDRDEAQFADYFKEHPWLALPYGDRARKEALSKAHKVRGIPTLIAFEPDGTVITRDARGPASADDAFEAFPWRPVPLSQLLLAPLESAAGAAAPSAAALAEQGKHVLLYFSAHWCPPCQRFTPKLKEAYEAAKANGKAVEVVFVSSDKSQEECDEYFAGMPWLRLPYANRDAKGKLSDHFGVEGIPSLVVLAPDLSVVNGDAAGVVGRDAKAEHFPWAPPPYCDLEEDCEALNEEPCLVAFLEGCDDADADAAEKAVAAAAAAPPPKGADKVHFFVARQAGRIAPQVRKICGLGKEPSDEPALLLVDLPSKACYAPAKENAAAPVTADGVAAFVAAWRAGNLEKQALNFGN